MINKFKVFVILAIVLIFVYLRITPIINQTVPYTYDQGRDFLKAEEIIRDKNITFIGPTTGIQGVHHGSWWYYFLAILYLIFDGLPGGFYVGLFIFSSIALLLFYFFIKKEFGYKSSLLFLLIITAGDFFIRLGFFASNNTISPLFILLLIYSVYQFFKTQSVKFLFLISFSLGFIFEFEVAFGIFMIISFFITSLFFKTFRNSYLNLKKIVYLISGLIIPFAPRLLFEVKNNFIQTKAFIYFYFHPTLTNQQTFLSTLTERSQIFTMYYLQLIPKENVYFGILIFLFLIFLLISGIKKIKNYKKTSFLFFSLLVIIIYFASLLSRNNFFWDYYLDGTQFIILFIIVIVFGLDNKFKLVKNILLTLFLLNIVFSFSQSLRNKNIPLIGLRADNKIVNYFVGKYPKDYFCVRIYTPPVIPYTYNYLFSYYANHQKIKYPKGDFYKNQCYFIFDKEPYQFRTDKWRQENIPKEVVLKKTVNFENGTIIELWSFDN